MNKAFGKTSMRRNVEAVQEKLFLLRMALFKEYFIDTRNYYPVLKLDIYGLKDQYDLVAKRYVNAEKIPRYKKVIRRLGFKVWSWFNDLDSFRAKVLGREV